MAQYKQRIIFSLLLTLALCTHTWAENIKILTIDDILPEKISLKQENGEDYYQQAMKLAKKRKLQEKLEIGTGGKIYIKQSSSEQLLDENRDIFELTEKGNRTQICVCNCNYKIYAPLSLYQNFLPSQKVGKYDPHIEKLDLGLRRCGIIELHLLKIYSPRLSQEEKVKTAEALLCFINRYVMARSFDKNRLTSLTAVRQGEILLSILPALRKIQKPSKQMMEQIDEIQRNFTEDQRITKSIEADFACGLAVFDMIKNKEISLKDIADMEKKDFRVLSNYYQNSRILELDRKYYIQTMSEYLRKVSIGEGGASALTFAEKTPYLISRALLRKNKSYESFKVVNRQINKELLSAENLRQGTSE